MFPRLHLGTGRVFSRPPARRLKFLRKPNCSSVLIRFLCIQIFDRERCIELGEAVCTGQKKTKFSHSHKLEAG